MPQFDPRRAYTRQPSAGFDSSRPYQAGGGFDMSRPFTTGPVVASPQGDGSMAGPRQRSLGERFTSVVEDAARRNPLIGIARAVTDARPVWSPGAPLMSGGFLPRWEDKPLAVRDPQTGQALNYSSIGQQMRADERERRTSYQQQAEADGWRQARGGLPGQVAAGATNVTGALVGAMADPLNMISPGKTVLGRIVGGAAVNAAGDVVTQGADIGAGLQDRYSPWQTATAGALGGVIQGGFEVAPSAVNGAVQGVRRAADRIIPPVQAGAARVADALRSRPRMNGAAVDAAFPDAPGVSSELRARARGPVAPPAIAAIIADTSNRYGVPSSYLTSLASRESGFNPSARAGTSSATGLFQFTDDTWLNTLRQHGPAIGMPDAAARIQSNPSAVLAMRNDPALNARAAAMLTADNARALRGVLGREPTDGELYAGHFLGEGRARQLMTADPNAPAAVLFPDAARANRSVFYEGTGRNTRPRTVAEVRANFDASFDGPAIAARGTVQQAARPVPGTPVPEPLSRPASLSQPAGPVQPVQPLGNRPDYFGMARQQELTGSARPDSLSPEAGLPRRPITQGGFDPSRPFQTERPRVDPLADFTPMRSEMVPPTRLYAQATGPRVSRLSATENALSPGLEAFRVDLPTTRTALIGPVQGDIRPDGTWRVRNAELPPAQRGQGQAVAAYESAAREAQAAGARLTSDAEVTPAAARVWEGLERRGYAIERNPNAVETSRAGLPDTMGMGPVSIRTADGSPVFQVARVPAPPAMVRPAISRTFDPARPYVPADLEFRQQYAHAREAQNPTSSIEGGPEFAPRLPGGSGFDAQRPFTVEGGPASRAPAFDPARPFAPAEPFAAPQGRLGLGGAPSGRLPVDLSAYGSQIGSPVPSRGQDINGLREAPRPAAIPRGEGAAYEGQTVSGLARDLRNALNLTARQGRVMPRAMGQYDTGSAVVRTKAVQELDVLAHEATHALEYQRNNPTLQAALTAHAKELEPLAYPGAARNAIRQEGFAEFGRWYLTNPEQARRAAPNFYAAFERALAQDAPDVGRNLQAIQGAYQRLLQSDSIEVAKGSLAYTGRRGPISDLAREFREQGPRSTIGRLANSFYTSFIDDLHPLSVAVGKLADLYNENTGRKLELSRANNPYALARLSREAYAAGHGDIVYGVTPYRGVDPEGPSLADALKVADIDIVGLSDLGNPANLTKQGQFKLDDLKEFDAYLISRRMVHEWDRFSAGELPRPPDRNTRQFHEQVIQDVEAKHPSWGDAAQTVYDWLGNLWRKEWQSGMISEESYRNGLNNHPDYVPLMRDVSDKGPGGAGKPRGALQFAGGVKAFEGSTRDILSPLSTMMRRSYELNAIIARNNVLKTLDDLADQAEPGAGAIVERLPPDQVEAWTTDAATVLNKTAEDLGLSGRDLSTIQKIADDAQDESVTLFRRGSFSPKRGEQVVFVWRDGKKTPLLLPDGAFGKELFDGITGLTRDQRNAFVDLVAAPTQLLRYGITLSPEFMVANLIRDQVATWINTDVGFRPVLDTVRGGRSELSQDAMAKRYATVGGMRGGQNVAATAKPFPRNDAEAIAQLQNLQLKGMRVRRFASWRGLAEATDLSETSTRLGVFRRSFEQAKRSGLDDYEAMVEAGYTSRDYLDFGRRGSKMIAAARLVTFLNAALQGLDKTVRVLSAGGNLQRTLAPIFGGDRATPAQQGAINHAWKAWAKVSMLGAVGLGLRMLYQDDPEYQEIGDQLRATHWVFKMDGRWTFVPKPFELATISNILERGYEGLILKDPTAGERFLSDVKNTIVPPYELPAVNVPLQIAGNRDGLGRPIVPDHLRGTVDPAQQFNAYTSQLGRLIGRTLNVSPAVVDHIITGFGGTLGRYGLQGTNAAYETATGAPRTAAGPEDMFLARRFVRDINRGSTSQKEFWDQVSQSDGDLTQRLGTFRQFANEANDAGAMGYLNAMDPAERGYVKASFFTQDGSAKLHPLVRARESLGVLGDLRRTVRDGSLMDNSGARIPLTPEQRRDVDDAISEMGNVEMRNALIATGIRGWAQKSYLDHREVDARLQRASPAVAAALAQSMMLNKVPGEAQVLTLWPQFRAMAEAPIPPAQGVPMLRARRMQGDMPGRVLELQRIRAGQGASR